METKRRVLLMGLDVGVLVLSLIGILFVCIQPDKGFFLYRYSSFYAIFAACFSIFSLFFLFFQRKEKTVSPWFADLELALLVASILSFVLTFSFSFPLFSPFDDSFLTSDAIYLSIGVPLLLAAKYVLTPKRRELNLFLFALPSLGIPFVYSLAFVSLQFGLKIFSYSDFPKDVLAYLSPAFLSGKNEDVLAYLVYFCVVLMVCYLFGLLFSLLAKRAKAQTSEKRMESLEWPLAEGVANGALESKKGDETAKIQGEKLEDESKNVQSEEQAPPEKTDSAPMKTQSLIEQKKPVARVYHVSKQQKSGLWQVKLASSKKAVKLFKTQDEAVKYAKELSKRRSGSVRVHSKNGRIRKG